MHCSDYTYDRQVSSQPRNTTLSFEKASHVAADDKTRRCGNFRRLRRAQHTGYLADNTKTVVNLREISLEDAPYAVPTVLSMKDILSGLPEIRQESVLILKISISPRMSCSETKRVFFEYLRSNDELTVLLAD